jgi:O-antigen ligase
MMGWEGTRRLPVLLGYAFIAVFCIGLLVNSRGPSNSLSWAIMAIAIAWLVFARQRSLRDEIRAWPLYWSIVLGTAFYFAALLTTTGISEFSGDRAWYRHFYASALALSAVASVGIVLRYDPAYPRLLSRCLIACIGVAAILLLVVSGLEGTLGRERLYGVPSINWFLNPNAIGAVYGIGFAIAIGHLLGNGISRAEMVATAVVALLALTVILFAHSRGALLGCAAALAVAILSLPRRSAFIVAGALLMAAIAAAIVFYEYVSFALLLRGDAYRFNLWQHYLELTLHRPLLGYGLHFDATYLADIGATIYTAHNQLLGAMLRGGLLGLSLLTATFAAAIWAVVAAAKRGWWLPAVVLAACLAMTSVDHEPVPETFGYYWYVFWLPLSLAAAAAIYAGEGAGQDAASAKGGR